MTLNKFLGWAAKEFTREDHFLMEAGSNSFGIHRRRPMSVVGCNSSPLPEFQKAFTTKCLAL